MIGLLEHIGNMSPVVQDVGADEWRRVAIRWEDVISSDTADDCFITLDIANITNGAIDDSWTEGDYATCETLIDQFLFAWAPHCVSRLKASELRWYRRAFNDYAIQKPFADSGPPVRVTTVNHPGTGTLTAAPQTALSITEVTTFPKNWGRFYLPGLGSGAIGPDGRLLSTVQDQVAGNVLALYDGLMGAEFFPVVPTTQVGKVPARGLLTVGEIHIDDVIDVIRRRRLKHSLRTVVAPLA